MLSRYSLPVGLLTLTTMLCTLSAQTPPAKTTHPWTREEAERQLALYPRDAYLQYVVMQLSRRENRPGELPGLVEGLPGNRGRRGANRRAEEVDLFSLFSGSLAVQESLQADTMLGDGAIERSAPPQVRAKGEADPAAALRRQQEAVAKRRKERVAIASLTGPTVKSHPWEQMLAGKQPAISTLARSVPDDYYFVEFRSLNKLLDAVDVSDLWSKYLFNQAVQEARTQRVGDRLKTQLVIQTNPLLRPVYDLVVESVAVTGSDIFLAEGSDVTILFRIKQRDLFKARMDGFLEDAVKNRPDVKRTTDNLEGTPFVHLESPDRTVNVFSAYPTPELHVRSNSRTAFERVLNAIRGQDGVHRLGDTKEFAYIRTLMPQGAEEEDGFIYLSDPFIRRLVGPQVKLTERHRLLCHNHLTMMGHASLLYRTQNGEKPASLEMLAKSQCAPGVFGKGDLACPDDGQYSLAEDGVTGICSKHGRVRALTPCCETPVETVSGLEADAYKAFLTDYNQYWRVYFDPIAVRIRVRPEGYRLETIILPLIDNSIYTGLAGVLGGEPEPLDALPVPRRNIFSVAMRLNKESLLNQAGILDANGPNAASRWLGVPAELAQELNYKEFLTKGIGNQIALHSYDGVQLFDLSLPRLFGMMFSTFSGRGMMGRAGPGMDLEFLMIGFLGTSLNTPVYFSIPIQDNKIVDRFLDRLDGVLAGLARHEENGFWSMQQDFYRFPIDKPNRLRTYAFGFGPVKIRVFWARIGNALYIASKPFILEDLMTAGEKPAPNPGPTGHAMVRIRPENWNQALADFRLGWEESNRQACLHNLGPLSSIARAVTAQQANGPASSINPRAAHLVEEVTHSLGYHCFCPDGGLYEISDDGTGVTCSIHGTALTPRQPAEPAETSTPSKLLKDFKGLTVSLTFLNDGLHAVVEIKR
jgi:hypothetical protein